MEKQKFEDFKRELKQRCDIVAVASRYVPLERRGRYYWCRCPFHGEKTPSLCINDVDGLFICYGCHISGDVIKFVMQIESLTFVEAIKTLAGWANMEVPESFENPQGGVDIELAKKRRDRLYELMKDAAAHYHENLSRPTASAANAYMEKRELNGRVAKHFGLGYADGFTEMIDYLKSKGYTSEEILAAGVSKIKDEREYDPLANRVIFPIIDVYGHVIAFGGRTLEAHPDFAKYLNTAETEIFNKRNTLYAVNYLKKQRQQGPIPYVIVVEGYMDAIALQKVGYTMTVASMGTSLTPSQAKMIKRFADKVYICYDGDSAGQTATMRGLDLLKDNNLDVFVVEMPDRFDPDDVIKNYGKEGYQKLLDAALPLVQFKLNFVKGKHDLSSVDGRVKFLNDAIEVLATIKSDVERELYTPMVSEISAINIDFIRREIEKRLAGMSIDEDIKNALANVKKVEPIKDEDDAVGVDKVIVKAEKYVLYALVHKKPYAFFKTDVSYLFSGVRKEIYKAISEISEKDPGANLVEELTQNFDDEHQASVVDIISYGAQSAEDELNEKKYYYDCLWKIYKNFLDGSIKDLTSEYAAEMDNIKRQEIAAQIKQINEKIRNKKVDDL